MERQVVPTILFANRDADSAMYGDSFRALHAAGYIRLVEVFDRNIRQAILRKTSPMRRATSPVHPDSSPRPWTPCRLAFLDDRIQTEEYGLDMGIGQGGDSAFLWKTRWGRDTLIEHRGGDSILHSLLEEEIAVPHACEVGVCGRAEPGSSRAKSCAERSAKARRRHLHLHQPTARNHPGHPAPVGSRRDIVSLALIAGAIIMGLWWVPPGPSCERADEHFARDPLLRILPPARRRQPETATRPQRPGRLWPVLGGLPRRRSCPGGQRRLSGLPRSPQRPVVSRFQEMRFAEQRMELGVHQCTGCHGEHEGPGGPCRHDASIAMRTSKSISTP